MRAEKSLAGFDSRNRLAISYAADLPIGKGQKLLSGGNGFAQRLTSGWSLSGTATFQQGYPLALTATNGVTIPGLGLRPNVVAGCNASKDGSAQSRLNAGLTLRASRFPLLIRSATRARVDPVPRGPGIANYNVSLLKRTPITERFNMEFRTEVYNLFNRVQFGAPNTTVTTAANATTGVISTQINTPRTIQFALRFLF